MTTNEYKPHRDCYYCGDDGFLFSDYHKGSGFAGTHAVIKKDHEGWPGIPHGGVGMASLVELTHLAGVDMNMLPWCMTFRFGGDQLVIGDEVMLSAQRSGNILKGQIVKSEGRSPYLVSRFSKNIVGTPDEDAGILSGVLNAPLKSSGTFAIPMFSGKLIFRKEYHSFYTHRFFEIRETEGGNMYLVTHHGDPAGKLICDKMNLFPGGSIHPGPLIAILDETMGWTAFLTVWQGGVTVELDVSFMREIRPDSIVVVAAQCLGVKGPYRKKIVHCHGGVFLQSNGRLVPAVYCRGRWLTDPGFKEKMLRYIIPDYDMQGNGK